MMLSFNDFKELTESKVYIKEAFGITYEQTKPEDFDHSELDKTDYTTEKSIHGKTHRLIFKVIPEHLRTGTTTRGSTFITDMASPIKVKVASKKVWKHADGSTYKDESHFTGKAQDITKIWSYIKSNGKPLEPGKTGEFNSEGRRESIKLDGVVYSKSGDDSDTISYTSPNRTSARWNR